jgi:hypothetical protein
MESPSGELEASSSDQILYSPRDQDLMRGSQRRDSCADMNCHSGHVRIHNLDLAGVESAPNLETEGGNGL